MKEINRLSMEKGGKITLTNLNKEAVLYQIDYAEFGTISITAVVGAEIELVVGDRAPVITINKLNGQVATFATRKK